MAHTGLDVREFVSRILDLATIDGPRAWLTLVSDLGALEVGEFPRSVVACHHGHGRLDAGRLTGRWPGVVGAQQAQWLILPARDMSAHRVLVSREDATVEASEGRYDLDGAGIADVTVTGVAVDPTRIVSGDMAALAGAGAAAVVVGSADALWRLHVEHLRAQLASSSDAITDAVAAQVAAAASDIDAARLQITELSAYRQAIARARAAADRLLEHSRHALDASHPVTLRWREVHLGSRLAVRVLDGLSTQLG